MSDTRPLKDDHVQPSDALAPPSEEIQKARDMIEIARDLIARTHQALDTIRQLVKSKGEILQYNQARRERQAEQRASAPTVPDEAGINILLITENPVDIARFRYALRAYALPCPMKVLTERSDVEAFVRRAATAAPLFLPRLIITDGQMADMETVEIVAAMRTVPAYRRIPILLFSALEEAEGQRRCRQCSATAFVHRPIDFEAVLSAVATMVYRWDGGGNNQNPAWKREEKGEEENGAD
jgi:two-component system, response regulator